MFTRDEPWHHTEQLEHQVRFGVFNEELFDTALINGVFVVDLDNSTLLESNEGGQQDFDENDGVKHELVICAPC